MQTNSFSRELVYLSYRPVREFTFLELWDLIYKVTQSNTDFNINDPIVSNTSIVRPLIGGVRRNLTHEYVFKRSLLNISNSDNLCFPCSLGVALVYSVRGNVRSGIWQKNGMQ